MKHHKDLSHRPQNLIVGSRDEQVVVVAPRRVGERVDAREVVAGPGRGSRVEQRKAEQCVAVVG